MRFSFFIKNVFIFLAATVLASYPTAVRASETESGRAKSMAEVIGGWESYVSQGEDLNYATYETALYDPAPGDESAKLKISLLYQNCDRVSLSFRLATEAAEAYKRGNLRGALKIDDQKFSSAYNLETAGDGMLYIFFDNLAQPIVEAMKSGQKMELSLPNLEFTADFTLDGFNQAFTRSNDMCGQGLGLSLF